MFRLAASDRMRLWASLGFYKRTAEYWSEFADSVEKLGSQ